jgi:arabinan endo-1,5-alpha-L-arabinosidase
MNKIIGIFFFSALIIANSCYFERKIDSRIELAQKDIYLNPVKATSLPDPTLIKSPDGSFYLYATEDIRNTPILKSPDLVSWTFIGTAFSDQTRPSFVPKGGIWAPDINFIDGKYVLFYSMSVWGGEWTCGIGVATSNKPEGPFSDHGKLFLSKEINVQNSIDPFYFEDTPKKYLFWGSFHGIYGTELSDDGLSVMDSNEKIQIAGTAYEGTCILKRNGSYYLFASTGTCCEGIKSTYTTVVGRSEHIFGPYLNKNGESMLENSHEILIHGNERFVGTGHNSEIIVDKKGKTWILYHAIDKNNPRGRLLMLDEVQWDNGWPFVEGNTPSSRWIRPVF